MFKALRQILFFLCLTQQVHSEVLIVTQAQVKNHVITSREVQIHTVLTRHLGWSADRYKNEEVIEQVIGEWLLYFEASDFYNVPLSSGLVDRKVKGIERKYSKQLKSLKLGPGELKGKIARRLEADRLFTFKKKASALPVPSSEIEAEYNQNRIRYGNLSFTQAQSLIRKNKIEANLLDRLDQWFNVLERKYKVQRFSKVNSEGEKE